MTKKKHREDEAYTDQKLYSRHKKVKGWRADPQDERECSLNHPEKNNCINIVKSSIPGKQEKYFCAAIAPKCAYQNKDDLGSQSTWKHYRYGKHQQAVGEI